MGSRGILNGGDLWVASVNGLDGDVTLDASGIYVSGSSGATVADALSSATSGGVLSVNGVSPGGGGNVLLDASDIRVSGSSGPTVATALESKQASLTSDQLAAASSGATAAKVAAWDQAVSDLAAEETARQGTDVASAAFAGQVLTMTRSDSTTLGVTVPVASDSAAGLLSAADHQALTDMAQAVAGLQAGGLWQGSFDEIGDVPTTEESALWTTGTIRVNDWITVRSYQSGQDSGTAHLICTSVAGGTAVMAFDSWIDRDIAVATATALGLVKGTASTAGAVAVDVQGGMTVNGWTELATAVDGKQAALSDGQMAAVNSGATAAKVSTWDAYGTALGNRVVNSNGAGAGVMAVAVVGALPAEPDSTTLYIVTG